MITEQQAFVVLPAAFVAGIMNAIAGGGSFVTLPALAYTGVSPIVANSTGTAALLPGYASAAWAMRRDIGRTKTMSAAAIALWAFLGGIAGSVLLAITPGKAFETILPVLILGSTALFAFSNRLVRADRAGQGPERSAGSLPKVAAIFFAGVYGGYFNGGLGVLLLAMLSLIGESDLRSINGAKNLASLVLTTIAVGIYGFAGQVAWNLAMPMMVGSITGGYIGGLVARYLPVRFLRCFVVLTGLVLALVFGLRAWH
ncbi:sulfite exporter TauE/SafE family protein [Noviherbaspirillum denitrificans]|uniref:Probable membrane transporter protein n=1 Tax=Noviherbaspirillum denitrificans TaxID=1968433 RepID=A0A254TDC9_9BURK|nr:sulfite exporter TauE/SafE family protein [Noviherbaspirillum denitrificans]OWW20649.1 hypothetical protein AYR66_15310 [Noviherbaspirillum denitrificans]